MAGEGIEATDLARLTNGILADSPRARVAVSADNEPGGFKKT
jgi:hypothetical protein